MLIITPSVSSRSIKALNMLHTSMLWLAITISHWQANVAVAQTPTPHSLAQDENAAADKALTYAEAPPEFC
jgi:hypothetical protein